MEEFFNSFANRSNITSKTPVTSAINVSTTSATPSAVPLTGEELEAISIKELLKTIEFNRKVLEEVKDMIIMGGDAEYAAAFAGVSKSNSDAIQKLTELALQKEKIKSLKEIKQMDIDSKKELQVQKHKLALTSKNDKVTNNNFLVMGREDVFNKLFAKSEEVSEKVVTGKEVNDVKELDMEKS